MSVKGVLEFVEKDCIEAGIRETEAFSQATLLKEVEELSVGQAPRALSEAAEEDVAAGLKEGSELVVQEARAGGTFAKITEKLKEAGRYMWEKKGAFAKAMGAEIAKGALFTVGMTAAEKLLNSKQDKAPTPENQKQLDLVRAINKERFYINDIMKEWRDWLANHYDDRDKYGNSSTNDGDEVQRFVLLQTKITSAQHFSDTSVEKATEALKAFNDTNAAKDLLKQETDFVVRIKGISDTIKTNYSLMVVDGLKDHGDEIDKAKRYLDDVKL